MTSRSRFMIAATLLLLMALAPAATLAQAPADSLKFTLDTPEGTMGRLSLWKTDGPDGSIRYGGSAVLNGTDKGRWSVDMSPDLRRVLRTTGYMKNAQAEIVSSAVMKEGGGKPTVTFSYNGNNFPAPVEDLPAEVFYLPTGLPTGLAPLSDFLANEDPATFSLDAKGTEGTSVVDMSIRGQGTETLSVRGREIVARAFAVTVDFEQLPEPVALTLYQFEDGTFLGMRQGEATMFVFGGPATESATSRSEETIVMTGGASLPGTLTMPLEGEGPFAGVVLVGGPNHDDRKASNGVFALHEYLAEEFAGAGIATLRFDPRADSTTLEGFAADAASAVAALAEHPYVDPTSICLLGHGEAAMVLAQAAVAARADSLEVRGLMMLGGAVATGAELHASSPRAEDAPWFASFAAYDQRPWLTEAALPLLAVHGQLDAEVPVALANELKAWAKEAGLARVAVLAPKGTNHYLQKAATGTVEEYAELEAECVRGFAKRLAGFVKQVAR